LRGLADENVPRASVLILREAGHDIVAVADTKPGASDREVLDMAVAEDRILLTFDRDFGVLVYRARVQAPSGIVLFRFVPTSPEEPSEVILGLLERPELELEGYFTVVDRERVRQRPIQRGA
jgi:predicted nuclease of predicted toxin-antitoxin system